MENTTPKATKDLLAELHGAHAGARSHDAPASMLRFDALSKLGPHARHVTRILHEVHEVEATPYDVASVLAEEPDRTAADVQHELEALEERIEQDLALHATYCEELGMRRFAETHDDCVALEDPEAPDDDDDGTTYEEWLRCQPEEHEPDPDDAPQSLGVTRISDSPPALTVPIRVRGGQSRTIRLEIINSSDPARPSGEVP